jgi:hypothetical protein
LDDGYPSNSYDGVPKFGEPGLGWPETARVGIDDAVPPSAADPVPGGEAGMGQFCEAFCDALLDLNCEQGLSLGVCLAGCEQNMADKVGRLLQVCGFELMTVIRRCEWVCDDIDELEVRPGSCPSEWRALEMCEQAHELGGEDGSSSARPTCTPANQCDGCVGACEACQCANRSDPSRCDEVCG